MRRPSGDTARTGSTTVRGSDRADEEHLREFVRSRRGVEGFVEMLTGDLTSYVRPLFTPGQINLARIRVEAELRSLGGGDLELGEEIVLERSERFGRGVNAW